MKKSELKQLIKEEISNILNEEKMKPILNEQLARMQKLAGIITENQINEDDIFNDQYSVSDEAYKRMDGLVNENDYNNFIRSATNIMTTLTNDGFEAKEIFYYLYTRLTAEV